MNDTSQPSAPSSTSAPAPPSGPPSAPPPIQTEVPVSTPVNQPRPLGDQAPPRPDGQESNKSSHISRREALSNAFSRAKEAQEEAAKSPPRGEPPSQGRKAEAKQQQKVERYREGGRFARDPARAQQELPLDQQPGQQQQRQQQPQQQPQQQQQRQIQPLHEDAPYRMSPNRFSDQAKQEWHATPESVRGAVHQMAKEFQGAYRKYKADNEVMNELRPYHDLAVKQGTSIRRAMDNYYGMEMKLRQDLVGGLDVIVQNVARSQGLVGPNGGPLTHRDVCNYVLSMTPEQQQMTQQRNLQTSSEQQLGAMRQQVERQDQILNQILYQQKFTYTRSQVDQFADTHPRFDELAGIIKRELDHGYSLEVAYKRAELLRPAHAAQNRTQSAQTRKTSISGAPDGSGQRTGNTRPSDGQRRMNGEAKHPTRREALARAMRRVTSGV